MLILPMALSLVMGYRLCYTRAVQTYLVQRPAKCLCFSLRLCFSNDVCRATNSWEDHEPEARIHGWMTLTKILVPTCLYCLNCTNFGQLILRKIIKIVATRCPILRLKCTKFDFGFRGSLQRSPRPSSWI